MAPHSPPAPKGSDASSYSPSKQTTGAPAPKSSVKSQLSSDPADLLTGPRSMSTLQFLQYSKLRSSSAFLPSNFFQSQPDIRTWGVQDVTDPSVQPYSKDAPNLPRPFHVTLPGYAPQLCTYAISKGTKEARDPLLGPEVTISPPTWVPQWVPDSNFKAQKYGYNWEDSRSYRMDRLPYVNAEFDPISAEVPHMYEQSYPYTSYPYGVPRV